MEQAIIHSEETEALTRTFTWDDGVNGPIELEVTYGNAPAGIESDVQMSATPVDTDDGLVWDFVADAEADTSGFEIVGRSVTRSTPGDYDSTLTLDEESDEWSVLVPHEDREASAYDLTVTQTLSNGSITLTSSDTITVSAQAAVPAGWSDKQALGGWPMTDQRSWERHSEKLRYDKYGFQKRIRQFGPDGQKSGNTKLYTEIGGQNLSAKRVVPAAGDTYVVETVTVAKDSGSTVDTVYDEETVVAAEPPDAPPSNLFTMATGPARTGRQIYLTIANAMTQEEMDALGNTAPISCFLVRKVGGTYAGHRLTLQDMENGREVQCYLPDLDPGVSNDIEMVAVDLDLMVSTPTAIGVIAPTVQAPTLTIEAERSSGTVYGGNEYRAVLRGGEVESVHRDPVYVWNLGNPEAITDPDTLWEDFPWDRVYDVDGTLVLMRGAVALNLDDETPWGGTVALEDVTIPPKVTTIKLPKPQGTSVTFVGHSLNRRFGWTAAHVHTKIGTNSVTVNAVHANGLDITSDPFVFTGIDPDVTFDGDTVCYSAAGNTAPAPAGADHYTDLNAAINAVKAKGARRRLLIDETETVDFAGNNPWEGSPTHQYLGSFGPSGGRARMVAQGATLGSTGSYVEGIIANIRIEGPYDASDGYSISEGLGGRFGLEFKNRPATGYRTAWNVRVSGWKNNFHTPSRTGEGDYNICVANVVSTDWNNFGFYSLGGQHHIIGSRIVQNLLGVKAPKKYESVAPFYPDHGPYRCDVLYRVNTYAMNRSFSNGGWNGDDHQPAYRVGGRQDIAPFLDWIGDRLLTDSCSFGSSGAYGVHPIFDVNILIDRFFMLVGNMGGSFYNAGPGGMCWRNGVTMIVDVPSFAGSWGAIFSPSDLGKEHPMVRTGKKKYYSSMVVDMRSAAHGAPLELMQSKFAYHYSDGLVTGNNAFRYTQTTPVDVTNDTGWALRDIVVALYPGRVTPPDVLDTQYALDAKQDTIKLPVPQAGCTAYLDGDATEEVSPFDLWGNRISDLTTGNFDRGPVQAEPTLAEV